uniref:ORF92 n=1 Tax=Malaco herpesvirus 1 TaxID=3031797 RepID=A0AA48SF30_9VIRU|nr:TPA_asm: ORF92 [Malaco herpesvirus 1]
MASTSKTATTVNIEEATIVFGESAEHAISKLKGKKRSLSPAAARPAKKPKKDKSALTYVSEKDSGDEFSDVEGDEYESSFIDDDSEEDERLADFNSSDESEDEEVLSRPVKTKSTDFEADEVDSLVKSIPTWFKDEGLPKTRSSRRTRAVVNYNEDALYTNEDLIEDPTNPEDLQYAAMDDAQLETLFPTKDAPINEDDDSDFELSEEEEEPVVPVGKHNKKTSVSKWRLDNFILKEGEIDEMRSLPESSDDEDSDEDDCESESTTSSVSYTGTTSTVSSDESDSEFSTTSSCDTSTPSISSGDDDDSDSESDSETLCEDSDYESTSDSDSDEEEEEDDSDSDSDDE